MNKASPRQEEIFATHVIDKALESILSKVSYKLVRKKYRQLNRKMDNRLKRWLGHSEVDPEKEFMVQDVYSEQKGEEAGLGRGRS